jgi:hypothetical protein
MRPYRERGFEASDPQSMFDEARLLLCHVPLHLQRRDKAVEFSHIAHDTGDYSADWGGCQEKFIRHAIVERTLMQLFSFLERRLTQTAPWEISDGQGDSALAPLRGGEL